MLKQHYQHHLIIDGHGLELTGTTFNFVREPGKECELYCYIRQGLGIGVNQSNNIIEDAVLNDNISRELAGSILSSKVNANSGLVTEKRLSSISVNPETNRPEWNNDHLFNDAPVHIQINGVHVLEFKRNNATYIRLPFDSNETLLLSDIISHYDDKQYNIMWVVCRAEDND